MLLVGGGQDYYGPTSERDKQVVRLIAKKLFNRFGNTIEIITGGMPGIPMDFVKTWIAEGGTRVRFIVSEEHLATNPEREPGVTYESAGKTQSERRQALTQLLGLTAALFCPRRSVYDRRDYQMSKTWFTNYLFCWEWRSQWRVSPLQG